MVTLQHHLRSSAAINAERERQDEVVVVDVAAPGGRGDPREEEAGPGQRGGGGAHQHPQPPDEGQNTAAEGELSEILTNTVSGVTYYNTLYAINW